MDLSHKGFGHGVYPNKVEDAMKLLQSAFIVAILTGTAPAARAQARDLEDTSMRGLPGIYVFVDKLPQDLKPDGVLDVELESQVELLLKKAGIKILERPDALSLRGKPFLYFQVRGSKLRDQAAYAILVIGSLVQRVILERDPSLTGFSRTWMISSFNSAGEQDLKRQIEASVTQVAEQFVKAYLSANQTKP
jgi:hypothetical protein